MNKICTSIEQSKKLIELGINIKSADMCWSIDILTILAYPITDYDNWENKIPAWSLLALLELIPNWTMDKTDKINLTCNPYAHCEACYENPIDAAFEMVCWLLLEGKYNN